MCARISTGVPGEPIGGMGIGQSRMPDRPLPPDAATLDYIPWLWNTFWQLLLSFVRFCCKHC